jgi:hypothetical protein
VTQSSSDPGQTTKSTARWRFLLRDGLAMRAHRGKSGRSIRVLHRRSSRGRLGGVEGGVRGGSSCGNEGHRRLSGIPHDLAGQVALIGISGPGCAGVDEPHDSHRRLRGNPDLFGEPGRHMAVAPAASIDEVAHADSPTAGLDLAPHPVHEVVTFASM